MTQIRGVFPLPQTSPQISGVVQAVALASGCVYVIPPGNYLVHTGPNTWLQWFDPLEMIWRPMWPHQSFGNITSDGTNYRLVNATGIVTGVTISAPGSAGTNGIGPQQTGTVIGFSPPPAGTAGDQGPTADGYVIIGGSLPVPQIVQPGSGFLVPPLIACDPPPVGGIPALYTASINAQGGLQAITEVQAGAGYTSVPQFYIIPQPKYYQGAPRWPGDVVQTWPAPGLIAPYNVWPGTIYQNNISQPQGALIVGQPLTGSGTVTGVQLTSYGGDYAAAPTITFTGGPLTGATATAVISATAAATDVSYLQDRVNV